MSSTSSSDDSDDVYFVRSSSDYEDATDPKVQQTHPSMYLITSLSRYARDGDLEAIKKCVANGVNVVTYQDGVKCTMMYSYSFVLHKHYNISPTNGGIGCCVQEMRMLCIVCVCVCVFV